jgi:large subunit ribosomal protein L2
MNCKHLSITIDKISSRNNQGYITVRTKGGFFFKKYRFIDFKRNLFEKGTILRIERDPYRNVFIGLVCYSNSVLSYIILTEGLKINQSIENIFDFNFTLDTSLQIGNSILLKHLPVGTIINNIELYPLLGSKICRSAGTFSQVIKKIDDKYTQIKLRSGEQRLILSDCRVVLGVNSNLSYNLFKLYKAGQSRWLGKRPIVRGRAMNPVDHPHGGRTNGGIYPRTPAGRLTKGVKTRKKSKKNKFIIIS